MIIYTLEDLIQMEIQLTDDTVVIDKKDRPITKRVRNIKGLEVGESSFIGNSSNKIKRISEDEYLFQRFDTISTHIDTYTNNYNLGQIHAEIIKELGYTLEFGQDRVKLVNDLLEKNQWIYNLVSTNKMIQKEIKKKSSFLAEDQQYDKLIDSINTYITHAKFINKEDKEEFEQLQKEKLKLEKKDKRKKTTEEFEELSNVIDMIQTFHHNITKKQFQSDNNTEFVGSLTCREKFGDFVYQEELKDRTKKAKYTYHKDEIPDEYWLKMYPSERQNLIPFYDKDLHDESKNKSIRHLDFRPAALKQMREEIDKLHKYLGLHIKDKQERNVHIERLKEKLEQLMSENFQSKQGIKYISGARQYNILRKSYTDLKSDYELAKKKLTDEFYFDPAKHSTEYNIESDTWYEDENGEIVELSKNRVLMSDANTYKGLILNYKDLKDKYNDKQTSDMWALIKDFEEVLNNTEFTEEELFMLSVLFDGHSQKQIEQMYKELELADWSQPKMSRLINTQIPNKLLNTYLNKIDEFIYTYKIKGNFKKCSKCGEIKLISNERYFYKEPKGKDGFKNNCKSCQD